MEKDYRKIEENPPKNGRYLVKFYTPYRPEYDRTELAWRGFYDGKWDKTFYNYEGDGYEMIGWYENTRHD